METEVVSGVVDGGGGSEQGGALAGDLLRGCIFLNFLLNLNEKF